MGLGARFSRLMKCFFIRMIHRRNLPRRPLGTAKMGGRQQARVSERVGWTRKNHQSRQAGTSPPQKGGSGLLAQPATFSLSHSSLGISTSFPKSQVRTKALVERITHWVPPRLVWMNSSDQEFLGSGYLWQSLPTHHSQANPMASARKLLSLSQGFLWPAEPAQLITEQARVLGSQHHHRWQ